VSSRALRRRIKELGLSRGAPPRADRKS